MEKKNPSNDVVFIRTVPREVKRKFKKECQKKGRTMTNVLVNFMREYKGD